MCGISGIYYKESPGDSSDIISMNNSLKHRGPDDEGYSAIDVSSGKFIHFSGADSVVSIRDIHQMDHPGNLWLGHRRLSIIDLSPSGHQPMTDLSGNICIVFNGEIYNYREIRSELKNRGYAFRSESDTEVLIYAYIEWGSSFVNRLNGMWAFVLYDRKERILFGARDRTGVKPLYYIDNNGFFAFASEIKSLVNIKKYSKRINSEMVYRYLIYGQDTFEQKTFFDGVLELPAASSFLYDLKTNRMSLEKYYSIETEITWENFDSRKAVGYIEGTRELVKKTVERHLISDVPVGSCLSGGIDSSSIVCNVNSFIGKNTQVGERQKVFTACYKNESIDESAWAEFVVKQTGAEWNRIFPDYEGLINDLEDLVYCQDYPFQSTSIYAQYMVMRRVKEAGIKVLLDGQGGDELFTGYSNYFYVFLKEMLKERALSDFTREALHLGNMSMNLTRILGKRIGKYFNRDSWYMEDYLNQDFCHSMSRVQQETENPFHYGLNGYMKLLMERTSLPGLLKFEDRNSMRFSIEARTPFADDVELIDYVFSIPSSYKINRGYSKYLLREACADVLPVQIKNRVDKIGFETPELKWLTDSKEVFRNYINESVSDFFNISRLNNSWDFLFAGAGLNCSMIWRIINFSVWVKVYFTGNGDYK